jgi:amidase
MVAFATAADGGGSIRIPAACCGLVGMKPTRGRVSMAPHREGWMALAVNGALARTTADSALLLDVVQGALASDADQAPPPSRSYRSAVDSPPARMRIALSKKTPPGVIAPVSTDQRAAWEGTGTLLAGLGHEVVHRDPAYGGVQIEFLQTWVRSVYEEAARTSDPARLEGTTRQMAAAGRYLVPERRRRALLAKRPQTTARILALWDEIDVLITPGLARTAIAAEGGFGKPAPVAINIGGRFTPFTPVWNLTGQPAVTVPAGMGADGLPLSVQLVGRPGDEDLLYALAGQIEAARPWAERRP